MTKHLWQSKTFWGVFITLFSPLLGTFSESETAEIAGHFAAMAGAAFAIYGRMVAERKVGL